MLLCMYRAINYKVNGTKAKSILCVNGEVSDWGPVTSGIAQGSVLGPLLFVMYINDLPDDITSDIFLFADDTKIVNNTKDAPNA